MKGMLNYYMLVHCRVEQLTAAVLLPMNVRCCRLAFASPSVPSVSTATCAATAFFLSCLRADLESAFQGLCGGCACNQACHEHRNCALDGGGATNRLATPINYVNYVKLRSCV